MDYQIIKKITAFNQSKQPLESIGGIMHSTGNSEDTADSNWQYFNSGDRKSNAHFFVDENFIIQCVELNRQAWHARNPANSCMWGIEFCETQNPVKFAMRWNRVVWLWSKLFYEHGIYKVSKDNLRSHDEENYINHINDKDNHTDPTAYFKRYNKTMDDMRKEVQKMIDQLRLGDSLQVLKDKGIITSPDYWIAHAVVGGNPDGNYVALLINNMADKLKGVK